MIRFVWSEGVKVCEIYERITVHYGVKSAGQRKFWGRYKEGRIWPGKSTTVIHTDFKEH